MCYMLQFELVPYYFHFTASFGSASTYLLIVEFLHSIICTTIFVRSAMQLQTCSNYPFSMTFMQAGLDDTYLCQQAGQPHA